MEKVKNRKTQKFRTIFVKFAVSFCIMTLALIAILFSLFSLGLSNGFILPANYVEKQIAEVRNDITSVDKVTRNLIPDLCEYAVFDLNGNYLYGSLDSEEAMKSWNILNNAAKGDGYQYTTLKRENEICILKYHIRASFSSSTLKNILPNVEILLIELFILLFITGTVLLAFYYGRMLTVKMEGLENITTKIQHQDLEFSIEPSGVYEIDNVLISLDKMKEALKKSLIDQWNLEQNQKEQISALAHDIKTPVTVIRGNAELLKELVENDMQKEFTQYILNSANQVEKYIKQLMDISKLQESLQCDFSWIDINLLINDIENQMKAIAAPKNIATNLELRSPLNNLYLDKELFTRAIINILDNAVEHTPENGKIDFSVYGDDETIKFTITDSGPGFSEVDLKEATKQFYKGDKGRAINTHYGMGLYIADTIIKQHEGMLIIENNPKEKGAMVTVVINKKFKEEK